MKNHKIKRKEKMKHEMNKQAAGYFFFNIIILHTPQVSVSKINGWGRNQNGGKYGSKEKINEVALLFSDTHGRFFQR